VVHPRVGGSAPQVVEQCVQMIAKTSDDGYVECCPAIAGWDGRQLLGRITAPTLVIGGSRDRGTPVTPHARTLAAAISRAKLEILDAAHLAIIEQADQANRLIAKHAAAR
jgi:3-oxoadipate enol-lactonase